MHRHFNRSGKTRIDLHKIRFTRAVAAELDLGIAFQVDFAHEAFRLIADIRRHGDALSHDRSATERWLCALRPLGKASIDVSICIEDADGFTPACEELLKKRCPPKLCQILYRTDGLVRTRHQTRGKAFSMIPLTP